jgi:hypothetical protein
VLDRLVLPDVRAHHVLSDSSELVVRTVQPRDAMLLARGMSELSPEPRYQRFFTPKAALSDAELHALTQLDGDSQYAIGVPTWDEEGREIPIGVARYVRDRVQPDRARTHRGADRLARSLLR